MGTRKSADIWNKNSIEELIGKAAEGGAQQVSNALVSLKNLCFLLVDKVSFLKDEIECLKRDNRDGETKMDGLKKTIGEYKKKMDEMSKCEEVNILKREIEGLKKAKEEWANELEDNRLEMGKMGQLGKDKEILEKEIQDIKGMNEQLKENMREISLIQKKQDQSLVKEKEETMKWIEVVKKGVGNQNKKEVISDTIEEERRREYKSLNVIIRGLAVKGSPQQDVESLFQQMGISLVCEAAWRVGKDDSRDKPLIVRFKNTNDKLTLLKKRVMLKGTKTFLDEDLTPLQLENRKEGMVKVMAARKEGKWAVFRDGRVVVRERRSA